MIDVTNLNSIYSRSILSDTATFPGSGIITEKIVSMSCERMSKLCSNRAILFNVDMIYLAKQAKHNAEKLSFEMTSVTKSNPERDLFNLCQQEESMYVLPVLAQNQSMLHMACS